MSPSPRVAIIYLSYKSGEYLTSAMNSLAAIRYPGDCFEIVIVDNRFPGDDSAARIRREVLPRSGQNFPTVVLLENDTNLGFAGGMNTGFRYALAKGFDYALVVNQDAVSSPDMVAKVVAVAESDPKIGAAQCLIRLHPEIDLIDSYGNELHYLGIGWAGGYRSRVATARPATVRDIDYASGAAALYRLTALGEVGLFDEELFLYHEDTDLSLRLKLGGWRVVIAPEADFFHKYEFRRSVSKFYWMLRNQLVLFFTILKIPTILLLLPMLIAYCLGTLFFSVRNGFFREALRALGYFVRPSTWRYLAGRRRMIQPGRRLSDRQLLEKAKSRVMFQDASNWVLDYFGNPIMAFWWRLVYPLIRW